MERKYSIGLLAASALCLLTLSFAFHAQYKYDQSQARLRAEAELKQQQEQSVTTQGNAEKSESFYLMELNGYVAVYEKDKKTLYEYTNIKLTDLPEELQKEISAGKLLESTEKLYGFLENYSS